MLSFMSISEADRLRARQRLALRAERAFGLNAIRFVQRSQDAVAPQDEVRDVPGAVHRADGPMDRDVGISAMPPGGGGLFGAAVEELRKAPPAFLNTSAPFTSEIL